jgi:O-antigen/teichoic acid export membrane protein
MSEQKSVMSGIGTMAALTISSKLVRLVILMITARFLTPEDFGVVAAFTMVFGFAYLFADIGIVRTIIQRPVISEKHIGSALALSVGLSVTIFFVLVFFSDYIANLLTIDAIALPLQISSVMFLLLGVSNICSALLQRHGDIVFIGKVQAFGTIAGNLFVTVPLLYFDIGYWSIIIGLWVSELFSVFFILYKSNKSLHFRVYKKELTEIIKYASAFFFNNTLGLVSQQIDIAIVSRFMGSAALGNYSRAMQLVEFPNQIYWLVVDRVIFPVMSAMKSEKDKLAHFFLDSLALLSFGLTIGTVILIVGAQEVVFIMMGDQWTMVGELLQILAGCIIFRALASFMDSFLAAYDLVKILTIKQIISLFILILSVGLAIEYDVTGIAIAVVIASALRFLLTLLFIVIKTQVTSMQLIKAFTPSILSSILIVVIYFIISLIPILSGLAGIMISVLLFLLVSIALPLEILVSSHVVMFIEQLKAKYFARNMRKPS